MSDIEKLARGWGYTIVEFFDVGANVGDTALAALKRFPYTQIHSFEPHPDTFATLEQRIGGQRRFHAEKLALGVTTDNMDMFEYDLSVLNSLLPDAPYAVRFKEQARCITVVCTTLDAYCNERGIERIDVLKIDTEGYDFNVLKGSTQMLAKGAVRFVYVEYNDLYMRNDATGGALLPVADFLRDYGFRFISSYNDYVVTEGELFLVSNALFAVPPYAVCSAAGSG